MICSPFAGPAYHWLLQEGVEPVQFGRRSFAMPRSIPQVREILDAVAAQTR
jgi:hypothetical protein